MRLRLKPHTIGLISLFISACSPSFTETGFTGFWEGPHPEDENRNFYIQLSRQGDSLTGKGYWTMNSFYESGFAVEDIFIETDSLSFLVPQWSCNYRGRLSDSNRIEGGFICEGEGFDPVDLLRKDEISRFLTEAKPGCNDGDYIFRHEADDPFESGQDSLFVYSLLPEIIQGSYGRISSFLLAKEGRVICEEYFYGYDAGTLHQIESSTKSITSLLVGIAVDRGMITDLEEPLYSIFPSYPHLRTGEYRNITLEHVLTMRSGFDPEYEPYRDYDRVDHALKRKLIKKPGESFIYDGGNTEILGAVLKQKTGMYADAFAKRYLFSPLGIEVYDWNTFRQNAYPCMGGSLELLPRDMLKIGLLVINGGMYNQARIVSEKWIKASTQTRTQTHIEGDDYGYQWWKISLHSEMINHECIWANGLGGQFIYILPGLDIVIVSTGHNYEFDSWAITGGISKYLHYLEGNV